MIQSLYERIATLQAEIDLLMQKLEEFLNNPLFNEVQNIVTIIENFMGIMDELKSLGILENVSNFNEFVIAIIENTEEIIAHYPNFEQYKDDFYSIGEFNKFVSILVNNSYNFSKENIRLIG